MLSQLSLTLTLSPQIFLVSLTPRLRAVRVPKSLSRPCSLRSCPGPPPTKRAPPHHESCPSLCLSVWLVSDRVSASQKNVLSLSFCLFLAACGASVSGCPSMCRGTHRARWYHSAPICWLAGRSSCCVDACLAAHHSICFGCLVVNQLRISCHPSLGYVHYLAVCVCFCEHLEASVHRSV